MDERVYYFDIHPPELAGTLDRFAQFFISPLFTGSCIERGILAVDSKNKKNPREDTWRLYLLGKSTSSKSHADWRFGKGSKEILWDALLAKGRKSMEELIKWHEEYWSADVTKLTFLGRGASSLAPQWKLVLLLTMLPDRLP